MAAGSGVEYEGAPGTIEDRYATAFDRFQASPDYNFRMTEGINAIDRSASARGKQLSGQNQKALMGYGQNLASGEWGNYLNRQANLAGIGQTATQGMMNAGSNAAANMGNAQLAGGNARASAYTGGASGINQGINNALYWYGREK
ncbi:MAG: hypothetical protein H8E94_03050 [Alphaproteobacteria bacterium]|nr:hypothetical protein [Alphaproteobacteria bacterium]